MPFPFANPGPSGQAVTSRLFEPLAAQLPERAATLERLLEIDVPGEGGLIRCFAVRLPADPPRDPSLRIARGLRF